MRRPGMTPGRPVATLPRTEDTFSSCTQKGRLPHLPPQHIWREAHLRRTAGLPDLPSRSADQEQVRQLPQRRGARSGTRAAGVDNGSGARCEGTAGWFRTQGARRKGLDPPRRSRRAGRQRLDVCGVSRRSPQGGRNRLPPHWAITEPHEISTAHMGCDACHTQSASRAAAVTLLLPRLPRPRQTTARAEVQPMPASPPR
jgi:hypothetical protein